MAGWKSSPLGAYKAYFAVAPEKLAFGKTERKVLSNLVKIDQGDQGPDSK
jgi:hypothetical protein